ncbi:uncharacterized protein LOC131950408 [Physella acuta]|uniref:uncharacterized protein LOC131950408 n=1 Tax=Physella acuta TaxID=109671 RepID=UPI0027DE1B29|nr:uncharacterized protein LOC131950408 [Physella acuta]
MLNLGNQRQRQHIFASFFVASFLLAALQSVTAGEYFSYEPDDQSINTWLATLMQHYNQQTTTSRPYVFSQSQLDYIKRLLHGLSPANLDEEQVEEIQEYLNGNQGVEQQTVGLEPTSDEQEQTEHTEQEQEEITNVPQVDNNEEDDDSDEEQCSGYKADPANIRYFLQFDGISWVKVACPPGLGFDAETCACSIRLTAYTPKTTTTTKRTTTTTTPTTTTTTPTTTTTRRTTTTTPTTTTTTPTTTTRRTTTTTPTTTTTTPTTTRRSTTTTTTTTRKTSTTKPSIDLCKDCVILHGVGYAPFPGHCDAYIQCQYYGDVPTVVNIRRCSPGTFWNQEKLTCDFEENVKCVTVGNCPNHKTIEGDRRAYLVFNGYSWNRIACPSDRTYSDVTCGCTDTWEGHGNFETCHDKKAIPNDRTGFLQLTGSGWVRMPCPKTLGYDVSTCRCTDKLEMTEYNNNCPNQKPITGDRTGFLQFTGATWLRMPCPATLGYDQRTCQCSVYLNDNDDSESVDKDDECKPALKMTFDDNSATDLSENQFWVNNTGVTFRDGKAYFDGKARLTVPGFSNMELGNTVFVSLKLKQTAGVSQQTIFTNGDCGESQSIGVCAGQDTVQFYALTSAQKAPARVIVSKHVGEWQYVMYALEKGHLQGYVGTNTNSQDIKGTLVRTHRGLVIGAGGECQDFVGVIDEITVYFCRPS